MKTYNELSSKEQLAADHYDFYKEVHGIRPRWMNYEAMSEQELETELRSLEEEAAVVAFAEEKRKENRIAVFEEHVTNTINIGAKDRATALRWIMATYKTLYEPEGYAHIFPQVHGDLDYFCYLNGLPYDYFNKEVV
jgi:hypothetical protein